MGWKTVLIIINATMLFVAIMFYKEVMPISGVWLLGMRTTMLMGLTGHCITAEQALNCGLITVIVPEEERIIFTSW